MSGIRIKTILKSLSLIFLSRAITGCGGGSDCSVFPDPSGLWTGVLERTESDCGQLSRGARFEFEHYVSTECDSDDDSVVYLINEDNRQFRQTEFDTLWGGSFSVRNSSSDLTVDISYENYDGSLADVSQKIRIYRDDKLLCSERYKGQARKR